MVKRLKKVPELNLDFSKYRNYISWIKFIKQAINGIYGKLDLKFPKLVQQQGFSTMFLKKSFITKSCLLLPALMYEAS